ncbi:uncharacterized protein LOC136072193 [Hydra vulgaris]|uniref:uncharacterized protein LOC136072193 n=1 Tax=Hydra vulgaris TaxID=6087 RepID=UPI0032E9EF01
MVVTYSLFGSSWLLAALLEVKLLKKNDFFIEEENKVLYCEGKSNETGNIDETQIPTNVVREIFHEMFSKQQKDIFKLISGNLKITNDKINELLDEIHKSKQICDSFKKENEKVNIKLKEITEKVRILEKTNKDIEESLTVTQDIQEKKVCELKKKIKNKNIIGEEEKNKLRQLEDRLRRNNLCIDGLPENDQETWDETEKKLLILFENKLNIRNVDIERAHRVGKKEENKTRTIVVKILHYKDK